MNPNNVSAPDPKEEFAQTPNLPKETPTPTLPNIGVDHTVQPISSEAEIRQAVAEKTPNTTYSPTSINPQSLPQDPGQNLNVIRNSLTNINPTPLIAPAVGIPSNNLSTQPLKKKHKWLIIIPIIISALLIAGYFAYRYFYPNTPLSSLSNVIGSSDTIKASDLIDVNISNTNFKRPKQWIAPSKTGRLYRDPSGSGDKFVAYLFVSYSGVQFDYLVNASDAVYEAQRGASESTPLSATMILEETGQKCTSKPIEKTAADRYVIGNSIGLYVITVTCSTDQGGVMAKQRTIVGRDGYQRSMTIVAPNKQWSVDSEVFNTILRSVQQA